MATDILIKGMVCERCVSVIKKGITDLGFELGTISLGKITLTSIPDQEGNNQIQAFLIASGFEQVSSRHVSLVSKVKNLIYDSFERKPAFNQKVKFSTLVAESLHMSYDAISEVFTRLEGITLEKFIINKRIEKVKELLVYEDLTLTEIAYKTGFSSLNYLSRQFKEHTGLSPSYFKSIQRNKRILQG